MLYYWYDQHTSRKRGDILNTFSHAALWEEIDNIVASARHLRSNETALNRLAADFRSVTQGSLRPPFWIDPARHPGTVPATNDADTLQFLFVVSTQSFVIWTRSQDGDVVAWQAQVGGVPRWGFEAICACHMWALAEGMPVLDADYLAQISSSDVEHLYRDEATGTTTIQMVGSRLDKYRETGRVLRELFGGQVINLLHQAGGQLFRPDGQGLIQIMLTHFPLSFGDWPFAKLPMIFTKMLVERRDIGLETSAEYAAVTDFADLDHLEGAADYYIPFFFMRLGVLEPDQVLADTLVARSLIPPGSSMEREFRAFTVWVFRALHQRTGFPMALLDSLCWLAGAAGCRPCHSGASDTEVACTYRPSCRAFTRDNALMSLRWPLVLTTRY
ncbi:MAG: queuosine salvage family protein [Chloroflexi bacterium]|nr:queuosine salvage family protein [Chloroflexota bacterium]